MDKSRAFVKVANKTPYLAGRRLYTEEDLHDIFKTERFLTETARLIEEGVMLAVEHYVATGIHSSGFTFFWTKEGIDLLWEKGFITPREQVELQNIYFYVHDSVGEKPMMRWLRLSAEAVVPGGAAMVGSFFSGWWTQPNRQPKKRYTLIRQLLEDMAISLLKGNKRLYPYHHEGERKTSVKLRCRQNPADYNLPRSLLDRVQLEKRMHYGY
jgi:hypothetical protein